MKFLIYPQTLILFGCNSKKTKIKKTKILFYTHTQSTYSKYKHIYSIMQPSFTVLYNRYIFVIIGIPYLMKSIQKLVVCIYKIQIIYLAIWYIFDKSRCYVAWVKEGEYWGLFPTLICDLTFSLLRGCIYCRRIQSVALVDYSFILWNLICINMVTWLHSYMIKI